MDKQEILDEINKTKEHLANMKKMLEGCEYKRWAPIDDELYYFVDSYGQISVENFCSADYVDNQRYKNYNCFQTKEQAEQESEKILVRRQLENIARKLNKGQKIDWGNDEQSKHCIELYRNNIITDFYYCHKTQGTVYCLDGNFKDIAIREIGEGRLLKYLRGE